MFHYSGIQTFLRELFQQSSKGIVQFRLLKAVLNNKWLSRVLILVPFLFSLHTSTVISQGRDIHFQAYSSIYVSSNETPFWHYANTRGMIRQGSSFNHLTGISAELPFRENAAGFNFSLGTEVINRFSDTGNSFHFQQIYGKVEYGIFRLSAGRFHETLGLGMGILSSGSMIQSWNATPVPKIKLETREFTDIPFTDGFFQFYAHYSDGFLESGRVVPSPGLHQKSLYLRFSIGDFTGTGGILHNVMWGGGESPRGPRPKSFSDYLRIVFSRSADPESDATGGEINNRLGNTVGAYDFAAQYETEQFIIEATRLFYLEDTPATKFRSPWDGTWSFGIKRKEEGHWINQIHYEHIHTINQDAKNEIPKGRANYYNHAIYQSGWSYYGNGLGNPLLTYDRELGRITNNMIIGHHLGLSGTPTDRFSYRGMITYSRNYGICDQRISPGNCRQILSDDSIPDHVTLLPLKDFRQDQYLILLELDYLLSASQKIWLTASAAADFGDYTDNTRGIIIGIKWSGIRAI